jgi:hypothetical protein
VKTPHYIKVDRWAEREAEELLCWTSARRNFRTSRKNASAWLSSVISVAYMTGYRAAQRKAARRRKAEEATHA